MPAYLFSIRIQPLQTETLPTSHTMRARRESLLHFP
jgi:hypothetical protein